MKKAFEYEYELECIMCGDNKNLIVVNQKRADKIIGCIYVCASCFPKVHGKTTILTDEPCENIREIENLYLLKDYPKCPRCGSFSISRSIVFGDTPYKYIYNSCNSCNNKWDSIK